MAGEKDLAQVGPIPIRARHWKVQASIPNFGQYGQTVKAFVAAGMPLEMIAHAARDLGDEIEEGAVDAPFSPNFQNTNKGAIVEDAGNVVAWQSRGEKTGTAPQIDSPRPLADAMEIVPISQAVVASPADGQIDVVEGMGVFEKQPDQLNNNPFLKIAA